MLHINSIRLSFIFPLLLILSACGGGGGGSSSPTSDNSAIAVSGKASLGAIDGGTITVHALNSDGTTGNILGTDTTQSDGTYSVNIGSYSGNVLVTLTGGSYTDEATGNVLDNGDTLRAALTDVSDNVSVAVTPLTEIAVQKAGTLSKYNIETSNNIVSNMIGGIDIINTLPANVIDASSSSATLSENEYGLMLAALSQMISDGSATDVSDSISQIVSDLSDNQINATGANISSALASFMGSGNNATGLSSNDTTLDESVSDSTMLEIQSTLVLTNASLNGTYAMSSKESGFDRYEEPVDSGDYIVTSDKETNSGTMTFDGQGGCFSTESGTLFSGGNSEGVTVIPQSSSGSCTYSLASDGTLTFGGGTNALAVSPNGNIITGVGSENELSFDDSVSNWIIVMTKKGNI